MGIKRNVRAVVVALVVLLLIPGVSYALSDQALVRLPGVEVKVAEINDATLCPGLTQDQVKTDIELRLRKAGIRVLTEKERQETPGQPELAVTISPYLIGSELCSYEIQVQLREVVTLARGLEVGGIIWDEEAFARTVGARNVRQIRLDVGNQVDKFINDYLVTNQK